MSKITLDKTQYQILKQKAEKYDQIASTVEGDFFASPPVRSRKAVAAALKKSGQHSKKFVDSVSRGLKHSSYFSD